MLAFWLGNVLYNIYLHPLCSYPGPWYTRASVLPFAYWLATGELTNVARWIHDQYGDSVRIAPNKLSFIQSQAWQEIHGEIAEMCLSKPAWSAKCALKAIARKRRKRGLTKIQASIWQGKTVHPQLCAHIQVIPCSINS